MRLWNDYEGTTIAEAYPIEKLIRPEGRSAFFSTKNGTGVPAVIRLIESINDEGEILQRWKTVASLNETHLVTLKKFGQTVFEGTPLIYVLMESTETDLGSILKQGTLSVDDARELAVSLVGAVRALHASGIVHEHIEPSNVMAAGEVVKLRSDCIREAPEGEEGIALMKQDVQDVATVLLQALTNRRSVDQIGATRLPAPLDAIIRNGLSGKWGLAQMASALNPPVAAVVAGAAPVKPVVAAAVAAPVTTTTPVATEAPLTTATTPAARATVPVTPVRAEQMPLAMLEATSETETKRVREPMQMPMRRATVPVADEGGLPHKKWWIAIAPAAVILLAAVGWHELRKPASEGTQPITTLSEPGASAAGTTAAVPRAEKPSATMRPRGTAASAAAGGVVQPAPAGVDVPRWRVVAYTYNRQDQAQHKVDELTQKDAALKPEVFSPHGGSPYLVTVGGAMTRADAAAFKAKASGEGLPRDIYIQNYEGRGRRR
ncbi:MAG: SPOR domain-containing protein [Granulicella sp.]